MSAPDPVLADRLDRLERELKDLRLRLAALERQVSSAGDHAADRSTVREKVAYDWQG